MKILFKIIFLTITSAVINVADCHRSKRFPQSSGLKCPFPTLENVDSSKLEWLCLPPEKDEEVDCSQVSSNLISGTIASVTCKPPYVNEGEEVEYMVICKRGVWIGEAKAFSCSSPLQEHVSYPWQMYPATGNQTSDPGRSFRKEDIPSRLFPGLFDEEDDDYSEEEFPLSSNPSQHVTTPSPSKQQLNQVAYNIFPGVFDENHISEEDDDEDFPASSKSKLNSNTRGSGAITFRERNAPTFAPINPESWSELLAELKNKTTVPRANSTQQLTSNTTQFYSEKAVTIVNKCPALNNEAGIQFTCHKSTPDLEDSTALNISQTDCQEPQQVGTLVMYKCAKQYEPTHAGLQIRLRRCNENGLWTGEDFGFSCSIQCGKAETGVGIIPLIINGEPTHMGQWPWHAALYDRVGPKKLEYFCGATLISSKALLTAAHCVAERHLRILKPLEKIKIHLGRYSRMDYDDEFVQSFAAKSIVTHDFYHPITLNADIAIIILKSEVTINPRVKPICYPTQKDSELETTHMSEGSTGTVVGFGAVGERKLSDILQMTKLNVVNGKECEESVASLNYGLTALDMSTIYCAGLNGTNVCSGDSGGGMYFPVEENGSTRWHLQGLVSFGFSEIGSKTCDTTKNSVFTKIGSYAEWIGKVLAENDAL